MTSFLERERERSDRLRKRLSKHHEFGWVIVRVCVYIYTGYHILRFPAEMPQLEMYFFAANYSIILAIIFFYPWFFMDNL